VLTQTAEWVDEWGTRWGHAVDGVGATPVASAIPDWSELEDYLAHRMPDPHAPGRLDKPKAALAVHGDDKYCAAMVHLALFERLHCLRGMENTLCDLGENEAEVERLLEALSDYFVELIREWGTTNISGFFLTDDWGSQTNLMISLPMWRKFFKAHYKRIFDEIHRCGKDVIFHSCGNVMRIIPDLIELGLDVLDPVQPGAMNLDELGRTFGGKVAFSGGIDVQRLEYNTPQQIRDEVRHAIDALGKPHGNAYLVAPANVISPTVPFENLQALFEASHAQ
jgi:uroporphyrinogen decarboxylase